MDQRPISELISELSLEKYGSESGPILELAKKLARQGRFDDVGEVLSAYLTMYPVKRPFLTASLRPIVLNSYLLPSSGISSDQMLRWQREAEPNWGDAIQASAADPKRLPVVVAKLLESMREFLKSSPDA